MTIEMHNFVLTYSVCLLQLTITFFFNKVTFTLFLTTPIFTYTLQFKQET